MPRANTDRFGRRGFSVSGPNQWNKLPHDIQKVSDKPEQFPRALKTFYFQTALTSTFEDNIKRRAIAKTSTSTYNECVLKSLIKTKHAAVLVSSEPVQLHVCSTKRLAPNNLLCADSSVKILLTPQSENLLSYGICDIIILIGRISPAWRQKSGGRGLLCGTVWSVWLRDPIRLAARWCLFTWQCFGEVYFTNNSRETALLRHSTGCMISL